ncbi:hypothetical protein JX265_008061 [Neoarthrinium moseri]|uniref:Uncharacterized protein n=1 Tax=Neoarthrinium moseri TaxID=1658444 RepID=A0A9Q0AMQ1_9PEZI|nr:hypothetical protein JX265_008061 [Neoarthrinium moseri]
MAPRPQLPRTDILIQPIDHSNNYKAFTNLGLFRISGVVPTVDELTAFNKAVLEGRAWTEPTVDERYISQGIHDVLQACLTAHGVLNGARENFVFKRSTRVFTSFELEDYDEKKAIKTTAELCVRAFKGVHEALKRKRAGSVASSDFLRMFITIGDWIEVTEGVKIVYMFALPGSSSNAAEVVTVDKPVMVFGVGEASDEAGLARIIQQALKGSAVPAA